MDADYAAVLDEFVQLKASVKEWHEASFEPTLSKFQQRIEDTNTEEGVVMSTMLAYVISGLRNSRRSAILEEFRSSGRVQRLVEEGIRELTSVRELKELQHLVGVEADGICGPRTRAAIREYDSSLLATSSACQ